MEYKKILKSLLILVIVVLCGYLVLSYFYELNATTTPHKKDKFQNILLNDVSATDTATDEILKYYNCYFNDSTVDNLLSGANQARINYINNSEQNAKNFNLQSSNINNLMVQLNNDILNNITENYGRAHILNKQREEMKKKLNDLPLKNI
jgi:Na+-transporting NADH:ubiquinone oxidoreductase subunit NqrC